MSKRATDYCPNYLFDAPAETRLPWRYSQAGTFALRPSARTISGCIDTPAVVTDCVCRRFQSGAGTIHDTPLPDLYKRVAHRTVAAMVSAASQAAGRRYGISPADCHIPDHVETGRNRLCL